VRGVGIREDINEPGREVFFAELNCSDCRKITFFEMQEMNVIELSKGVVSEIKEALDELEASDIDFNEEDMFQDENIRKKKDITEGFIPSAENKIKKRETSKITLKNVREVKKALKPKDLKHESFLEMLGIPPEEIARYHRETE
jgi:hypothetical protein